MTCPVDYSGGRPSQRRAVARAGDQGHPDAHSESVRGFADSSTDLCALGWGGGGGGGSPSLPTGLPHILGAGNVLLYCESAYLGD